MSLMDRITAFLDRLAGLPRWQTAVLVLCAVAVVAGGYLLLRPPTRPAAESAPLHARKRHFPKGTGCHRCLV